MRKQILLGLSLVAITFFSGQKLFAEDVDLTDKIINNDFEFTAEGVPMTGKSWKPKDLGVSFYGWECDLSVLGGSSQGINDDMENQHGTYGCWFGASKGFPDFWEFSQTITGLEAGNYKVQCLMSGTKNVTNQRLFANQNVQYCMNETDYPLNQVEGEVATFAGHPKPTYDKTLSEMVVYTTIEAGEPLKIGIRTSGIMGDGTKPETSNMGWFKADYFRLTKVDRIPTGINNPELKADYFVNNGTLTVNGVDAYTVYNINGAKIAEVNDAANSSVDLMKGIYIVRAHNSEAFKVVVK